MNEEGIESLADKIPNLWTRYQTIKGILENTTNLCVTTSL
jgi:hypothetical protein